MTTHVDDEQRVTMSELRPGLSALTDDHLILRPIAHGLRVKIVNGLNVDLLRMLYDWRIATSRVDTPTMYERGWCYIGYSTSDGAFHTALVDAVRWPGTGDTEPERWNRCLQTGESRPPCSVCARPVPDPPVTLRVVCPACLSAEPCDV